MDWTEFLRLVPTERIAQELHQRTRWQESTDTQALPRPVFCQHCSGIIRTNRHVCQQPVELMEDD